MPVPDAWNPLFASAGLQYGVDPALLKAQASVESGGDEDAVSSTGARGPMQMMPATAAALGVSDSTDPKQAIFGAAKLMRQNLDRYGDTTAALKAYHGGTNQKNWGPLTQAYPNKVMAAYQATGAPMDSSYTAQPLPSDAGSYYFDPSLGAYVSALTGQPIQANVPARPGDSQLPSPSSPPPTGDGSSVPPLDTSSNPAFGNSRFGSGFSLNGPQAAPPPAPPPGPPPGLYGVGAMGMPSGSIFDDPNYKNQAILGFAGGLASGNPATAGAGAGFNNVANVYGARLNNNMLMLRATQMYGTPLARMVQAGVPLDTARRTLGLPPTGAANASYSSKPMSSADIKQEQSDTEEAQSLSNARARLQYFRDLLNKGKLSFYPGASEIAPKQNAIGLGTDNSQSIQSFISTMNNIRQDNLSAANGVQTDKDAENEMQSLMPNLSNTTTVKNHVNNLINNYAARENQVRERINQRRAANKQPPIDWKSIDASTATGAPQQSSSDLLADPYADHSASGAAPAPGKIGVTSKGTKYSIIGQ